MVAPDFTVLGNRLRVDNLQPCVADTSSEAASYRTTTPEFYLCRQYLQIDYAFTERFEPSVYQPPVGYIDATKARVVCPQTYFQEDGSDGRPQDGLTNGNWNWLHKGVIEDEHCHNLNVYTPDYDVTNAPTIFYVHGGGGDINSNLSPYLQPDSLAAKGAVVGMPNYRLGALGALDTGTGSNYNISDLLAAWEWFRANVSRFGGNPDKIIVVGPSFGGDATHALAELLAGTSGFAGMWSLSGGGARRIGPEGFQGFASKRSITNKVVAALQSTSALVSDASGLYTSCAEAVQSEGIDWALKNSFPQELFNAAHTGSNLWMWEGAGLGADPITPFSQIYEPCIFQSVENEANLRGITKGSDSLTLSQYQVHGLSRRLGLSRFETRDYWSSLDDAEFNRFLYGFATFNFPTLLLSKYHAGTSWLNVWNYKSAGNGGDYAGHTSDACYMTGNPDWQVGVIDGEAQVYWKDLWVSEAMQNALISFAEHLNPNTPHSGPASGRFLTEPYLSMPSTSGNNWNVLGKSTMGSADDTVASTSREPWGSFPAICLGRLI